MTNPKQCTLRVNHKLPSICIYLVVSTQLKNMHKSSLPTIHGFFGANWLSETSGPTRGGPPGLHFRWHPRLESAHVIQHRLEDEKIHPKCGVGVMPPTAPENKTHPVCRWVFSENQLDDDVQKKTLHGKMVV